MGTINFPGLSTGLDTSTLISQLINADSGIKNMYQARVNKLQSKQESLVTFKSDLNALQTAVKSLSNANDLKLFNISTSDDTIVTADATSSAYEGNHTVFVKQLATADRWVQSTGFKYKEDYVGTGTFIYSYGGKETRVTTTDETTLEDFVGLINNDSNNPGVTASLLSYNNQYHLVLSGKDAGTDYSIHVNPSSTEVWQADSLLTADGDNADTTTLLTRLEQFSGALSGDETLVVSGTDHNGNSITPVNLDLTSNTKISHILDAIEDAYDGNVKAALENGKIVVTDKFSGASAFSVSLAYNDTDVSGALDLPTLTESVPGGGIEVWQGSDSLTAGGTNAGTSTSITALDQFGGALVGGETIEITGNDHDGNAISLATLNLGIGTTISQLLSEIESAFTGNVEATIENGKITVADKTAGPSQLSVSLNYNANGSGATLDLPAMAVLSDGAANTASLAGFTAADFTRSQVAQDSKIKVDGYPSASAVSEVQQIVHSSPVTGMFTLSYGGYTTSAINSATASISDIQTAINALPSVQPGDITVSGTALNGGGTLTFEFKNTLGDVSGILINASNLSDPTLTVTENTKGIDEYISRSSNTITDVVDGITFYLHGVSELSGEQITLTRNSDALTTKINAMVTAYNTVVSFIKDKTAYNTQTKTAGVLMGDYTVTTVNNQLYTTLVNKAKGFLSSVDDYLMPAQIGLAIDSNGQLSLDSDTFNKAVSDNYLGVLALIGATKTGTSNSNTVGFYAASDNYTTAGQYNVKVTVSGGVITSAEIKASDESDSAWRDMTISGNTITGNSTFDSINGSPLYAENGLQLTVDLSQDSGASPFTATIDVKQGFAGAIEDALKVATKNTTGYVDIDNNNVQDEIDSLNDRISEETDRLAREKDRLTAQFARLEATLTLLQSQMGALGFG
jgi:flagellar hook-associated protein 2